MDKHFFNEYDFSTNNSFATSYKGSYIKSADNENISFKAIDALINNNDNYLNPNISIRSFDGIYGTSYSGNEHTDKYWNFNEPGYKN